MIFTLPNIYNSNRRQLKNTSLIFSSLLFLLCTGIFLSACTSDKGSATAKSDTSSVAILLNGPETDSRLKDRKFEQVPAIAGTADGKVMYVAWYSGGAAPGPGNYVTVAASLDTGKTWLQDQLAVYPRQASSRIFDPGLWRDKNGQIHLFYGSAKDSLIWDGFGGVNSVEITWDGSKINHSVPERLNHGVMSNKPIYLASKDMTLVPLYIDKPLSPDSTGTNYPASGAYILSHNYSDSKSLKSLKPYSEIKLPEDIRIHDEPQLVEVSDDGAFMALVRTTKGIYFTKSSDYGKTWSEVQPFTASGPTTSSRFYIGRLASGNILLIANNSTTRNNMTAFLSKDGGKTWPYTLLLDARENVSYPDADQSSDGTIHVVFDRDRTGAKDILYCRFTESTMLRGNAEDVFKTRVNK